MKRLILPVAAILAVAVSLSLRTRPAVADNVSLSVQVRALRDTVVAHQTAWIEVRIGNTSSRVLMVPIRNGKIVGEWRFEDGQGTEILGWPNPKEIEKAGSVTLGPGESLYEVMAPESCFGVFTNPGILRATCRVQGVVSAAATILRRPQGPADPPSALRAAAATGGTLRDKIQLKLWSDCAGAGNFFDCDEALFTVAWDRVQATPAEGVSVVDTLISRFPKSGWCRPALYELVARLSPPAARKYLGAVVARHPGGVAENYAAELLRRDLHGEFPGSKGRKK